MTEQFRMKMREPLKIWHMAIGMAIGVVCLLTQAGSAVWYVSKQEAKVDQVIQSATSMQADFHNHEVKAQASHDQMQKDFAMEADLAELRRDVNRIDVDGAKVYLIRRPEEIKAAEEMRAQVKGIETTVNNLNIAVAQLLVLTKQAAAAK